MVRPGRNLVGAVSLLALAAVSTFLYKPVVLVLAVALLLLLVAAVWDWRSVRLVLHRIECRREMPAVVGRGLAFLVRVTLLNGNQRSVCGDVRDVVPTEALPRLVLNEFSLNAAESDAFEVEYSIPRRGEHTFGPLWLRVHGPWGLIDLQEPQPCPGSVKVLPETYASREELIKEVGAEIRLLEKITLTRQHGSGTEFESLNPYRYGDDPRRIDWRTTARVGSPIVRRYQVERHRDVMVLIDCGRMMGAETDRGSKLDCAVDAGLNLARVALQSGDRCGIGTFDDRVRGYLPPVSGVASIRAVAGAVYDLQTYWRETDFMQMFAELQLRQTKRSLIVVLSDINDVETSQQFRAALSRLASRHIVLFAALRTPLLNRIIGRETNTVLDGARKAVTFRLLRERQQSLHTLKRSGVRILDVEPQQLTLPLINQFVEIRRQDLL